MKPISLHQQLASNANDLSDYSEVCLLRCVYITSMHYMPQKGGMWNGKLWFFVCLFLVSE